MITVPGLKLLEGLGHGQGCSALIAVKERVTGKSRLAASLGQVQRMELIRRMLTHVLGSARSARTIRQVIVVSPERDTVPGEIPVLADSGHGLNRALCEAHRTLISFGISELLILPADLPMLAASDIDTLVEAGQTAGFAVAPDASGAGTNGLYLSGPQGFRFQFGPRSCEHHVEEARRLGFGVATVSRPGLEFDVDGPADLQHWNEQCRQLPRLA